MSRAKRRPVEPKPPEPEIRYLCPHCYEVIEGEGLDLRKEEGFYCHVPACPEDGFHPMDETWSYGPEAPTDQQAYNRAEAAAQRAAFEAAERCGQPVKRT